MPPKPIVSEDWKPSASLTTLRLRATLLTQTRQFFKQRGVLEVETPVLSHAATTDPHIECLQTLVIDVGDAHARTVYLQTSPEFAMKRLLAADYGSIFQIAKVFRDGELGRHHNPEFSMLEWYRVGYSYLELMDEVEEYLGVILDVGCASRQTYAEVFESVTGVNPHIANVVELARIVERLGIKPMLVGLEERDYFLDLIMSHGVVPTLGRSGPVFIYDYPRSQCALATIRAGAIPVAERFEVFIEGIEVANGFNELTDADEMRNRFAAENRRRRNRGARERPMDERLLAASMDGFPQCSGVAMGFDRLVMIAAGASHINDAVSFPFTRS